MTLVYLFSIVFCTAALAQFTVEAARGTRGEVWMILAALVLAWGLDGYITKLRKEPK